jgi:hypothetical protein
MVRNHQMHALPERSAPHNGTLTGRQLRRAKPAARVVIATELCNGGLIVTGLSCRQAARLTSADRGAISVANHATPDEREALERGKITIAALRKPPSERAIANYVKRIGLTRIIAIVGPGPALDIIDQLTAPANSVAK